MVPSPPGRVVVLEGIYALSSALRGCVDLRVAVGGGIHRDLLKRVLRDVTRSGQAPGDIVAQARGVAIAMGCVDPLSQFSLIDILFFYPPPSGV